MGSENQTLNEGPDANDPKILHIEDVLALTTLASKSADSVHALFKNLLDYLQANLGQPGFQLLGDQDQFEKNVDAFKRWETLLQLVAGVPSTVESITFGPQAEHWAQGHGFNNEVNAFWGFLQLIDLKHPLPGMNQIGTLANRAKKLTEQRWVGEITDELRDALRWNIPPPDAE